MTDWGAPTSAELATALRAVLAQLDDMAMGLTALHATLDPARGVLLRWDARAGQPIGESIEPVPQPEAPRIAHWLERSGYQQIADAIRREEWRDADADTAYTLNADTAYAIDAVRDRFLPSAEGLEP